MSFLRNLLSTWRPGAGKSAGSLGQTAQPAPAPAPQVGSIPPKIVPAAAAPIAAPEDCIALSLKAITDLFPPELKPALRKQPSEHVLVNIPRAIIKPQLASGVVRITFAELRAATPEIFFHPEAVPADAKLPLPLDAILLRMMPLRREDQRQPAIPVSIPSIFAKAGGAPARPGGPPASEKADPWYSQRRPTYEGPAQGEADNGGEIRSPKSEIRNGNEAAPGAALKPIAPAPAIPEAPAAAPSAPLDSLVIPLATILPGLAPEIRQALGGAELASASFVIPLAEFEPRMRVGKLQFKWAQLSAACSIAPSASLPGDLDVELPLATVVPLFLATRQAPDTRKKIEVDARIPDVFGKTPPAPVAARAPAPVAPPPAPVTVAPAPVPAAPAPAPVAAAIPTHAPMAPAAKDPAPSATSHPLRLEKIAPPTPAPPQASEPAPATSGAVGAEPEEIIRGIRALDGVTGAFLATADGLLIAGDVPDANDNVLAAFAPTVFSQLGKYSEMARLGLPEAIDLHLKGATVHVRKTGRLFLGVLMPRGMPLPLAQLDRISAILQPNAS